jgi:methylmalonyl-CoA decarboxylase
MIFIKKLLSDNVGIITMDNDDKRNSLSMDMLHEFCRTLEELAEQKARVVIIRSNPGAQVWSAGLDINELPEPGKDPLPYNHPLELLMRKIEDFPAPVIAMIEGSVWGGGCDLAFTCDMLIGSPNCSFAITPAKIGVPYNATGLVHFLNFVEMNIAKEMFFTAKPIDSARAHNLGIINHLVPLEEMEDFTMKMATDISYNSPLAISVIKEQLNLLGKARPMNPFVFEQIAELRRKAYNSHDFLEGKNSFLEKRHPVFKGE